MLAGCRLVSSCCSFPAQRPCAGGRRETRCWVWGRPVAVAFPRLAGWLAGGGGATCPPPFRLAPPRAAWHAVGAGQQRRGGRVGSAEHVRKAPREDELPRVRRAGKPSPGSLGRGPAAEREGEKPPFLACRQRPLLGGLPPLAQPDCQTLFSGRENFARSRFSCRAPKSPCPGSPPPARPLARPPARHRHRHGIPVAAAGSEGCWRPAPDCGRQVPKAGEADARRRHGLRGADMWLGGARATPSSSDLSPPVSPWLAGHLGSPGRHL